MEQDKMKIPPNNTEAERAVLGAILLDTTGRNDDRVMDLCLTGGVRSETFYDPRNRIIYEKILEMNRLSKPIDALTVVEELRVDGRLETVGGVGYLQSLLDNVQTTSHAEYYINIIRGKALRRTMIDRATKVIDKCFAEGDYPDPQAILGDTEKAFLEIGVTGGETMPWAMAVNESFNRINAMFNSRGVKLEGLSTGLTHLDEKLQGLKNSEMIVIAARPSVGKTSLAMNIAESCALGRDMNNVPVKTDRGQRHPVLIFSLEMPVESLTKRMIAGRARVNMWRLNRNLCPRQEREEMTQRLFTAVGELKDAPIYVDDSGGLDIMDLRARARRMKKAHGIELIVIDYLQLAHSHEYAKQGKQAEVSHISGQIKAMAKELKVPVIVLSQLSRDNEKRGDKYERPKLSDLRDSGAIEQDADVVFLLRRPSRTPTDPDSNDEYLAIIDVAKNRNGEIGEVKVNFIREFTRFCDREIERKEGEEGQYADQSPSADPLPEQDAFM